MMLLGVDYHPSFQQIASVVEETGECEERQLNHSEGEAKRFYRDLKCRGIQVRVGMEATGYSRWFERLLAEFGFELWIGDPAEIKSRRVKKQKTDRKDAQLLSGWDAPLPINEPTESALSKLGHSLCRRAEFCCQQLDVSRSLHRQVRHDLLVESQKHPAIKLLRQVPSMNQYWDGYTAGDQKWPRIIMSDGSEPPQSTHFDPE
jgi:hypothetical protein